MHPFVKTSLELLSACTQTSFVMTQAPSDQDSSASVDRWLTMHIKYGV